MADLYNSDLGRNSRKASPSSMFGTREIKWLQINFDDNLLDDNGGYGGGGGYMHYDSFYQNVVQCIQEVAEIIYLGAPTRVYNPGFVFGIATDTAQWEYSDEGNFDANAIGIDESDDVYPNRYIAGSQNWPQGPFNGINNQLAAINDIVDRLSALFGSPSWWQLVELEDCGFGLMPGRSIADPNSN